MTYHFKFKCYNCYNLVTTCFDKVVTSQNLVLCRLQDAVTTVTTTLLLKYRIYIYKGESSKVRGALGKVRKSAFKL